MGCLWSLLATLAVRCSHCACGTACHQSQVMHFALSCMHLLVSLGAGKKRAALGVSQQLPSYQSYLCRIASTAALTTAAAAAGISRFLQTLSPARPPSPYANEDEDGMQDEDLAPSPVSELLMECFAGSSGGAVGVPAAAAPLLVMLRDDGSCMAYKVRCCCCCLCCSQLSKYCRGSWHPPVCNQAAVSQHVVLESKPLPNLSMAC
jgi:hypothetical protein